METTYRTYEGNAPLTWRHPATAPRCLMPLRQRAEARLRLICFPYAGGAASVYRSWPEQLPSSIDLWALQLPGRGTRFREEPVTDFSAVVDAVAEEARAGPDLPLVFFGHSLGALIAYEVARRLRASGGPMPVHLFVSAYGAPHLRKKERAIHLLPDGEFLAEIGDLNGTPASVFENSELMQLVLPALRADFELHWKYEHRRETPLDCSITALGGFNDPHAGLDDLEAWKGYTREQFSVRQFPGDHFFLHSAQHLLVWSLWQQLSALLQ